MKSMESYFSFSGALIRENLKRFWAISVLSFIGYFLSGVLPILFSLNRYQDPNYGMGYMVRSMLNNQYFPHGVLHLVVPIVASVILYRYMHSSGSSTMIHGLPFTRSQLFNSNLLSGLILVWLPLLVTAGLLLLLARPMFLYEGSTEDIFTKVLVFQWIWKSLVVTLSVYLVAVLAGVVSGNGVMHMFLGFWFNGLLPGLYAVCVAYFGKFLYGFDGAGQLMEIATGMMPYLKALQSNEPFSSGLMSYYLIGMVALLVVSSYAYRQRAWEKAGDSLVFQGVKIMICYLIAFFGMSLMAFYFDTIRWSGASFLDGHAMFYVGLLVGILVFLYIGRMVVLKSPRVFNKGSLKHLAIYTLIALTFVVSVDMDFTGFEKRVPNPQKVEGVSLPDLGRMERTGRYEDLFFQPFETENETHGLVFQEPENVEAIAQFHRRVISERAAYENQGSSYQTHSLSLSYQRKNFWDLTRSYVVPYSMIRDSVQLKKVFESSEFKDRYSFQSLTVKEPRWIKAYNLFLYQTTMDQYSMKTIDGRVEIRELMEKLEQDYRERTWEQHLDTSAPYAQMEMAFYGLPNQTLSYPAYAYEASMDPTLKVMTLHVRKSDRHTISWLEERGYDENLSIKTEDVGCITVFHETGQPVSVDEIAASNMAVAKQWTKEYPDAYLSGKAQFCFENPEDIAILLEEYEMEPDNYQDYYFGVISFKKSSPYANRFYEHYGSFYQSMDAMRDTITVDYYIYFNNHSLPEIIRAEFQ